MRLTLRTLLALLLALGLASGPASATVVEPLTLDALVARATFVVRARVSRLDVIDAGGRYITRVTLAVTEPIKGEASAGQTLQVDTLGGTMGPFSQRVAGEARFVEGEDVVVCLEAVAGRYVVLGMSLGKFTVDSLPSGVLLRRDITGLEVAVAAQAPAPARAMLPAEVPLTALRDLSRGAPALAPSRP